MSATMKTVSRFCAFVVALLLAGSGASTYLCAESTRPVCPPKTAHVTCHDEEVPQASLKCCCTLKDVPTQPPATDTATAPTPEPALPHVVAYLAPSSLQTRTIDSSSQPLRNCDLPTLFSTFLL